MTNMNTLTDNNSYEQSRDDDRTHYLSLILFYNRKILIISFILGLIFGTISYFNSTRLYTATSTVKLHAPAQTSNSSESVINFHSPTLMDAYSPILLDEIVESEDLTNDPEFNETLDDPSLMERYFKFMMPGLKLLRSLFVDEVDDDQAWEGSKERLRLSVQSTLEEKINIFRLNDGRLEEISVTTTDRLKSARIANIIAEKLRLEASDINKNLINQNIAAIDEEINRVEKDLTRIAKNIEKGINAGLLAPDIPILNKNIQQIFSKEHLITRNRHRGEALARLSEIISQVINGENVQSTLAGMPDDMRAQLTPDYRKVFRWAQLDDPPSRTELLDANRQIKRDIDTNASAAARLEQEILPVRDHNFRLMAAQNRYRRIKANYNATAEELTQLRKRRSILRVQRLETVSLWSANRATPPINHAKPSLWYMLLIGGIIGSLIGCLIAIIRLLRRDAFFSLEDIEQTFDAPAISLLPNFDVTRHGHFAWSSLPMELQEAYRRAYWTAFVMPDEKTSRSLMIASAIPGEGKTMASLYIAAAAVEAGNKTLIIDLDFRKRSLSRYLRLQRQLGVYSVFRGEAGLNEAALPFEYDSVSFNVLTADGRQNSKNLYLHETLSVRGVRELIKMAKEQYEVVIIDVPAIRAAQDANMIGRLVDDTLCVVSTLNLSRKEAERATKEWNRAGLGFFGLIVRGERSELDEYYGYRDYFGMADEPRDRRPTQRRRRRRDIETARRASKSEVLLTQNTQN